VIIGAGAVGAGDPDITQLRLGRFELCSVLESVEGTEPGPSLSAQSQSPDEKATSESSASSEHRSGRRDWMIDLGVGCLAAVFCFVFIVQPQAVDPVIYLEAAQDFLGSSLNHWTARIGIVIPVSLFSMLFGYSEAAYYAVPLIAAFGFGYATSMLGRYIMAPRVGIAAAAMAISGPIVLPFATLLMPDVGAAALLTVSFGLLIKAAGAEAPNSRLLILSGSVFGAAYLVREFALIFLPALILAAVVLRLRWASIAKLLAGMVLAPLVESIVGLIAWGEPLPRLTGLMGVLSREAADSPGILGRGLSAQSTP
jgi:hypothetical protein